jgi:hypothetical protein
MTTALTQAETADSEPRREKRGGFRRGTVSPEVIARRRAALVRNRAELAAIRERNEAQPLPPVWRPTIEIPERAENLHFRRRRSDHEIAGLLGLPPEEFARWWKVISVAVAFRPHAIPCIKHLFDLTAEARRPPEIGPADIERGEGSSDAIAAATVSA